MVSGYCVSPECMEKKTYHMHAQTKDSHTRVCAQISSMVFNISDQDVVGELTFFFE